MSHPKCYLYASLTGNLEAGSKEQLHDLELSEPISFEEGAHLPKSFDAIDSPVSSVVLGVRH
jgi:hypothetical protein